MKLLLQLVPQMRDRTLVRSDQCSAKLRRCFLILLLLITAQFIFAQQTDQYILLKPDRVFDGEKMQTGWVVLIKNNAIEQAGNMLFKLPANTKIIELKGCSVF